MITYIVRGVLITIYIVLIYAFYKYKSDKYGWRHWSKVCCQRRPLNDCELYDNYFSNSNIPRELPGTVRSRLAEIAELPANKLLPDDDLWYFFRDLEGVEFFMKLESTYQIDIPNDEMATQAQMTVRWITEAVGRQLHMKTISTNF